MIDVYKIDTIQLQMAGDMLSVVTIETAAPSALDKTELAVERAKRLELEIQAEKYREQIADYEGQLAGLKLGLEGLQGELERCQNAGLDFDSIYEHF